jgi:hypothetical protein
LRRPTFLVSISDLPVDEESVAFHVLHGVPTEKGLSALRLTLAQSPLWDLYSQVFELLYPQSSQEVRNMARKSKGPVLHFKEFADRIGWKNFIEGMGGEKKFIDAIGTKKFIEQIGKKQILDELFESLSEAERVGLERRLAEAPKKGRSSPHR